MNGEVALLAIWACVFTAAGWYLHAMSPHWLHGDPMRRLADADRKRLERLQRQHDDEQAFLLAEIHGDGSDW